MPDQVGLVIDLSDKSHPKIKEKCLFIQFVKIAREQKKPCKKQKNFLKRG